jgi:hypothetical protein
MCAPKVRQSGVRLLALREQSRRQVAAALQSEKIFRLIRHFALACRSSMIFPSYRYPLFRIMLWRERRNAAFTINEEQSALTLVIAADPRPARQ